MSELLLTRAKALKLHGLVHHLDEVTDKVWVENLLLWEEEARHQRSLQRRIYCAQIGRFKPLAAFDWQWPKSCDRELIDEFMKLEFIKEVSNIIICGPNGVGKTTIASNIAYEAVIQGHTVILTTAGKMLNDLASQDGDNALRRRIKHYTNPTVLVIDEIGYLSYSNRHADLLFEIISRRYQVKPTIVTTNKPFTEWGEVFPNASCVVSLVDRLVHKSDMLTIDADSFRLKEATERSAKRKANTISKKAKGKIA
jgi:DNA replication protein DnaC